MELSKELSKQAIFNLIENKINPIILDVGTYDGKDSLGMSTFFERPKIHCFECDPRSIDLWLSFHRNNRTLKLHDHALSNVDGLIDFHMSDSKTRRHYENQTSWSASSSIKKPKHQLELFPDINFLEPITVKSKKLDTWYKHNIPGETIDFIWCDVNGGQQDFVLGGIETLTKHTKYLYIEFSDKEMYEGEITKAQLQFMLPFYELLGTYNFLGNFGNILLKNTLYV